MNLFKSEKKEKTTKTDIKNIDGKYCIYHHGLGILKHECGTLLCRECLWESDKCPNCDKIIVMKKGVSKKDSNREKVTIDQALPKYKQVIITPQGSSLKPVTSRDISASTSQTQSNKNSTSSSSDNPPLSKTTQIQKIESAPLAKSSIQDRGRINTSKKSEQNEIDKQKGKTSLSEGQDEDVMDIYDDDLAQKRQRGYVPRYKRLHHAKIETKQDEEDDDDEKEKKKWEVRTVPPVPKKRDYESL